MPLVKAQCTNCGANLEVDSSKDAAICEFCGTAYVVEKAIQKATSINAESEYDRLLENYTFYMNNKKYDKAYHVSEEIIEKYPAKDMLNYYRRIVAFCHDFDVPYWDSKIEAHEKSVFEEDSGYYNGFGLEELVRMNNEFRALSSDGLADKCSLVDSFISTLKSIDEQKKALWPEWLRAKREAREKDDRERKELERESKKNRSKIRRFIKGVMEVVDHITKI